MSYSINDNKLIFDDEFNNLLDDFTFPYNIKSITFTRYQNNTLNEKIKEINIKWLSVPMTNLPLFLERIIFLNNDYVSEIIKRDEKIKKSKIPFGCEIIYE